jgi:hypothetical protein
MFVLNAARPAMCRRDMCLTGFIWIASLTLGTQAQCDQAELIRETLLARAEVRS